MSQRLLPILLIALVACQGPPIEEPSQSGPDRKKGYFPQSRLTRDVALLFVISTKASMAEPQQRLTAGFAELVAALRTPELGPDGTGALCTERERGGCRLPRLHVGVVSADLGGAPSGDGTDHRGKLLASPMVPGCVPPTKPFIAYVFDGRMGVTNIPGAHLDPIGAVVEAFGCIARLGNGGSDVVQPLEAAWRALDWRRYANREFLRTDALLAVVLVTDVDDASPDELDHYVDHLRALKPPRRVLLASIAPRGPGCGAGQVPRIDALVTRFAPNSQQSSICEDDFGSALGALGDKIRGRIVERCIDSPLITMAGELVCAEGDTYAPGKVCTTECLHQASCDVIELVDLGTTNERTTSIARCPSSLWDPEDWQADRDCGDHCPCWRVVNKGAPHCDPRTEGSPHAVDVLRRRDAPGGTVIEARCLTTPHRWGSAALGELVTACAP